MIEKFTEFISNILNKPGMYLVSKVEDLQFIIFGYLAALQINMNGDELADFMYGFRRFVVTSCESKEDFDWSRLIRFYSSGDSGSLELFSKLFRQYLDLKNNSNRNRDY